MTNAISRRILAFALAIATVIAFTPAVAFTQSAEAADAIKGIQSGIGNITGYDSTNGYDYIYYGINGKLNNAVWQSTLPIKWRVLSSVGNATGTNDVLKDDTSATVANKDAMFLLSDNVVYQPIVFDSNLETVWEGSEAQTSFFNNIFYAKCLSAQENAAMLTTTKTDAPFGSYLTQELKHDKAFYLSAEEESNSNYGFIDNLSRKALEETGNYYYSWWLRSPNKNSGYMGYVANSGIRSYKQASDSNHPRPAFNLNTNMVILSSAALENNQGKQKGSTVSSVLFKPQDYTGNEWKLTLKDSSRSFAVTGTNRSGNDLTVSYTGATVYDAVNAPNEYISAIVKDGNGNVTYYGRLAQPNAASGTVDVTIPDDFNSASDTLYLFSEQYNGDKMTDYASALNEVLAPVHVYPPTITTQPVGASYDIQGKVSPLTISTSDSGAKYQWQQSADGTTWTNIDGATNSTYTPPVSKSGSTKYRCIATGSNGLTTTSDAVTITVSRRYAVGATFTKAPLIYKVTKQPAAKTTSASKNGTVRVVKPVKKTYKSISVPASVKMNGYTYNVTTIGKKAFYKNSKLKTVTIKSTKIASIGSKAFKGCRKAMTIKVPKSKYKAYKNLLKGKVPAGTKIKKI
jgi:hypothetical protein